MRSKLIKAILCMATLCKLVQVDNVLHVKLRWPRQCCSWKPTVTEIRQPHALSWSDSPQRSHCSP